MTGFLFRIFSVLKSARHSREQLLRARGFAKKASGSFQRLQSIRYDKALAKADAGDTEAQYELGERYYYGQGVYQDYTQAALWFRKAAEQGHVRARSNIGLMHLAGRGVERDPQEAGRWLRLAAAEGDETAVKTLKRWEKAGGWKNFSFCFWAF